MNKLILLLSGVVLVTALGAGKLAAQQPPATVGATPGGPPGGGNFDPQQFQQMIQDRIMGTFRDRLAITNDDEWKVIEERLSKIVQTRMEIMMSSISPGMLGGTRPGGNQTGGGPQGGAQGFRGFPGFAQSPETEALQKAVDDHAPAAEIRAALAKLREVRKQKEAQLARYQEDLRKVITVRQEAELVYIGALE